MKKEEKRIVVMGGSFNPPTLASPYDKIWGIGLDRETAMKGTVEQWQGENLLGCALMEVRDYLMDLE